MELLQKHVENTSYTNSSNSIVKILDNTQSIPSHKISNESTKDILPGEPL